MKSLVKNSICNIGYRCINVVYPLIISAYVSRVLLADGVGKVASAQNMVQYFTIIATLGIPTYGIRIIAQAGQEKNHVSKVFSELFFMNAISTSICFLCYYLAAYLTGGFGKGFLLYGIAGIAILLNYCNVDWFFQGKEEYQLILIRNVIVKVLSILAVFLFVKSPKDCVLYAVILVVGTGLNNVFNILQLRKHIHLVIRNLNLKQHRKAVFTLFSATIAIEVYTLFDTTMLTYMCNEKTVGLYANAVRSISAVKTMMVSICAVFLPRLSVYKTQGKTKEFNGLVVLGLKILLLLSIPAAVGMILVSELLVPLLFGSAFLGSIVTTQILAVSIVTVSLSNYIGYQVLVSLERENIILFSTIIGAFTNVILNAILIRNLEQNGAAIASIITEAAVATIQMLTLKKYVRLKVQGTYLGSIVFATLSMILCVKGTMLLLSFLPRTIELAIAILVGVIAYVLVGSLFKNEILKRLFGKNQ